MKTNPTGALVDQVFLRCVEDCFEPIMLTDKVGKLKYVNPAWSLTYGYSKDEALGNSPRLLRSDIQPEQFYTDMWKTIQDSRYGFWRGEVINRAKDGHLVPVLLTITPYREVSGDIVGYMGIAVDLTEQKKMEQQIRIQDRLASIGMLAGGMAHEIGNPLGVIRGRAELVREQVRGNSLVEKNIDIMIGQIDRISELMNSLLNFSRVPTDTKLKPVSLKKAVDQVVELMQPACDSAGINLICEVPEIEVFGEANHLQQVFLNLILNAMHAIEDKPKKIISITSLFPNEETVVVKIKDSGNGVPAHAIEKIFQPFYTTKSAGKGTGLGLPMVSKLMTEMKGQIALESSGSGEGATFTLTFCLPQTQSVSSFDNSSV